MLFIPFRCATVKPLVTNMKTEATFYLRFRRALASPLPSPTEDAISAVIAISLF